jgi:Fe2+ or Zn2+ uptake regulation protein
VRSPEELTEELRSRGLKMTPQRALIFELVHGVTTHPTAEAVFDEARRRMPTISLKTVYQTLNDLAALGDLQMLDMGTGAHRFDPNVAPHHHLVCRSCGAVLDVLVDASDLTVPPDELHGFTVDRADIVFRGTCASCCDQGVAADDPDPGAPGCRRR